MDLHLKSRLETGVTVVSNTFIDNYMAEANGEYVKVYLYLLRRGFTGVSEEEIADALNDTEADVRRALAYWKKVGVLGKAEADGMNAAGQNEPGLRASGSNAAGLNRSGLNAAGQNARGQNGSGLSAPGLNAAGLSAAEQNALEQNAPGAAGANTYGMDMSGMNTPVTNAVRAGAVKEEKAGTAGVARSDPGGGSAMAEPRPACTKQEIDKLSSDAEFTQLIYIAQQYLKKIFTPKDCECFAYLYGTLKMPAELLEYLVEYCAQNNHTSLRYIEKVALSWYEKKLLTVEEAKAYSRSFSKDSFAVMKAFGLTGRSPADAEYKLLEKWYRTYGFTKELVLEACNRTMNAIHAPSFQYADKILTEWKTSGVRTMRDVEELDRIRQEQKAKSGQGQTKDGQKARTGKGGRTANRFHNLEEHGYDYDKMVWNMINPGQDTEHTE